MESAKKERSSNFGTAVYIAESQGNDVPDELIIEVAKALNMKPKVLLRNYKSVSAIDKIFGRYLPQPDNPPVS